MKRGAGWGGSFVVLGAVVVGGCFSASERDVPSVPTIDDPGVSAQAHGENGLTGAPEHLNWSKAAHGPGGPPPPPDPKMTFHNGTVLVTNRTQAIFWGSEWTNASFAGDKISGLDTFFTGFGGSAYAGASTEYAGTNGQVTRSSTYVGHVIDSSTVPNRALSVAGAVAEACKITANNPDPAALYLIYTSTDAGHVSYCAWHSYGSCSNGAPVQVAYMPNIDGLAGCDPQDTWTGHSQGLAALANVTAHELSEAITDPRNGGWYDADSQENGDKCAWAFHDKVTFGNGSVWKLQMEWSNAAFIAGSGYPNRSGQLGCLQGSECTATMSSTCAGQCGLIDTCNGTFDCGACPDPAPAP